MRRLLRTAWRISPGRLTEGGGDLHHGVGRRKKQPGDEDDSAVFHSGYGRLEGFAGSSEKVLRFKPSSSRRTDEREAVWTRRSNM